MLSQDEKTDLELLIDRTSATEVLIALCEICGDKAEHIRENWQDDETCKPWDKAAAVLDRTIGKFPTV